MQTLWLINSRFSSKSLFNGEKKSRDDLPACALTSTSHNESVPCLRSSRMYTCHIVWLFWSHLSSLMKWQLTFSPAMPSWGGHRRTCRCWRRIPANLAHLWNWLRLSYVRPIINERCFSGYGRRLQTKFSPITKTVNSWWNAKPWLRTTDTSWTLTALGNWTDHHLLESALVTEQVSGLPSTARAASAEAKVEDWSAGLRRATLAWKSVQCKRYPSLFSKRHF